MGLRAALVDRARLDRQVESTQKVQGRTKMVPDKGAWFKARLTIPQAAEAQDSSNSRKITRGTPSIMFYRRDEDGDAVMVKAKHRLEVESNQLVDLVGDNRAIFEVVANPEPIRKKRTVIGWQSQLRVVDEQERE